MSTSNKFLEVASLATLVCERLISAEEADRLSELLQDDTDAQQHYLQHLKVDAYLSMHGFPHEISEPREGNVAKPAKSRSPVVVLFTGISQGMRRSPLLATLLVAVLIYGVFGFLAWDLHPDKLLSLAKTEDVTVAMISNTTDVRWSGETISKQDHSPIRRGEPLKIDSGIIELELKAGTKLVVEGPADWSIDGKNNVALRTGKLLARVPQQAIGFTMETPTVKIVDLGTEFGVEVSEHGATEVQVLKGKVDVSHAVSDQSGTSHDTVHMTAGQSKLFGKQNGRFVVKDVEPATKDLWAKSTTSPSRRIAVQGVLASSEIATARATALIDGSGMKGDSHATYHFSDNPNGPLPMWDSAIGKIKNEFVLFDLGKLYRLDSMKVWNFNDSRYNFHTAFGVKQADIYVSISGKWDPLKEPNEWKLVVDDFKFSMAPGTDDYDTPDVIPLHGTEARFVAIVIADHFGPDPRSSVKHDVVGLSEVQFFGERLSAAPAKKSETP